MPPPRKAYSVAAWAVWRRCSPAVTLNPSSGWQPQAFILSSSLKTQAEFWDCLVGSTAFRQAPTGRRSHYPLFEPLQQIQAKRLWKRKNNGGRKVQGTAATCREVWRKKKTTRSELEKHFHWEWRHHVSLASKTLLQNKRKFHKIASQKHGTPSLLCSHTKKWNRFGNTWILTSCLNWKG